jgi:hypothetical protein
LPWVLTEIGFGQLSVPVRFPVETRLMALDALVIASTS